MLSDALDAEPSSEASVIRCLNLRGDLLLVQVSMRADIEKVVGVAEEEGQVFKDEFVRKLKKQQAVHAIAQLDADLRSGVRKSGGPRYQADKDDEDVARARSVERHEKAASVASKSVKDAAAGQDRGYAAHWRAKEAAKTEAARAGAPAAGGKEVAKPSA